MTRRTVIDYDDVFSLSSTDDDRLFSLSDAFRHALLQIVDRLEWASAWTQPLTDEEQAHIQDGIRRLIEEEVIDMTVTIDFAPVINVTSGASSSGGCSSPPPWDGVPGQCYPIEQFPTEPDGGWNAPPQPPDTTDEEWDAQRCALANYAYEQILEWLERASQVTTQLGTVAVILFFLWSLLTGTALVALIGGTLLGLAATFAQWAAYLEPLDEIFDYVLSWWVDKREEIVCKFYNATNAQVLQNEVVTDLLSDLITYASARPWWFTQMETAVENLGWALLPAHIFLAPFRLIPPAGYVGLTDCSSCGTPPPQPGDSWAVSFGIGSNPSGVYGQNTEEDHNMTVIISGAGAGASVQQGFDELIQLQGVDPETYDFTAVTFYVTGMEITAPAGNAAVRQIRYGSQNAHSLILEEVNANGVAANAGLSGVTVGLRLATHEELGTDVEIVVEGKEYLRPQFIFDGVGYGLSTTTWELSIETFTMIP